MMLQVKETHISHLIFRGNTKDPLAVQMQLSQLLDTIEFLPPGIPASAILVVRSFADPLPHAWQLSGTSYKPGIAWHTAVQKKMQRLFNSASRPSKGMVSSNAEAVYFFDRSEFLACLTQDWLKGLLLTHWWWKSFIKNIDVNDYVQKQWLQSIESVPGALQQLSRVDMAVPLVDELSDEFVLKLTVFLVKVHGLRNLIMLESYQYQMSNEDVICFIRPRWIEIVPELKRIQLTAARTVFLLIGMSLVRAPSYIRSNEFTRDIKAFHEFVKKRELVNTTRCESDTELEKDKFELARPSTSITSSADKVDLVFSENLNKKRKNLTTAHVNNSERIGKPTEFLSGYMKKFNNKNKQSASDLSLMTKSVKYNNDSEFINFDSQYESNTESTDSSLHGHKLSYVNESVEFLHWETQYGGAFFLINLAIYLELYGDFTQPEKPGIDLPVWDFVAILLDLFTDSKVKNDPLWLLLAELSGRSEPQIPGVYFDPPERWCMPVSWVKLFKTDLPWQVLATKNQRAVIHPFGFIVSDIKCNTGDLQIRLEEAISPYQEAGLIASLENTNALRSIRSPDETMKHYPEKLQSWLRYIYLYAAVRLQRAINVSPDKLGDYFCKYPANIKISSTQLIVTYDINQLPLQVRMSGLDRDPGWVPAASRDIRFVFE